MKHAYLILAHKNAEQLVSLVRTLDGRDSHFFIHLDKKSGLAQDPCLAPLRGQKNVHLVSAVDVRWGGLSLLKALLLLFQAASKNKRIDYFHTLSGQCYPLGSRKTFSAFFRAKPGKEYLEYHALPAAVWADEAGGFDRLRLYHLNDILDIRKRSHRAVNKLSLALQKKIGLRRELPAAFKQFYRGSCWFSISRNAVEYLLDFMRREPGLVDQFRHTFGAKELFFPTLILNSPLAPRVVNENLRYIEWKPRDGKSPVDLDERDYAALTRSKKLFARKFEAGVSDTLRAKLDRKLSRAGLQPRNTKYAAPNRHKPAHR